MPFPSEKDQFVPGQSGNPGGYSRGRRIRNAIHRMLDEKGLERTIALTFYAMATGDRKPLNGRKPSLRWFREFLDRVDGPVGKSDADDKAEAATAGDEPPKRIIIPDVDDRLEPR